MKLNLDFYPYPNYEAIGFWVCNLKLKEMQTGRR
jgi:hypothetical protein